MAASVDVRLFLSIGVRMPVVFRVRVAVVAVWAVLVGFVGVDVRVRVRFLVGTAMRLVFMVVVPFVGVL